MVEEVIGDSNIPYGEWAQIRKAIRHRHLGFSMVILRDRTNFPTSRYNLFVRPFEKIKYPPDPMRAQEEINRELERAKLPYKLVPIGAERPDPLLTPLQMRRIEHRYR